MLQVIQTEIAHTIQRSVRAYGTDIYDRENHEIAEDAAQLLRRSSVLARLSFAEAAYSSD